MKPSEALEKASAGLSFGRHNYYSADQHYCTLGAWGRWAGIPIENAETSYMEVVEALRQCGVELPADDSEAYDFMIEIVEYNDETANSFSDMVNYLEERGR